MLSSFFISSNSHLNQDSTTNPDSIQASQESVPNEGSTLNTNQDQHPQEPRSPSESEDLARFMSDTQGQEAQEEQDHKKEEETKPYLGIERLSHTRLKLSYFFRIEDQRFSFQKLTWTRESPWI